MVAKAKVRTSKAAAVETGMLIKAEVFLVDAGSNPAQIAAPGTKVGDILLKLLHVSDTREMPDEEDFDQVVRDDGYITQLDGSYSGIYVAILCRFS